MHADANDSLAYHLLCTIIRALVDRTEAVLVTPTPQPEGVCFAVTVHSQDIGKLIGKEGRTARSIRTLLSAVGMKMRRRYSLDIVPDLPPQD